MHERHYALTDVVAGSYEQAADVCLSRHHDSPVTITIADNGKESNAEILWTAPTARVLAAWANTDDATRDGAYACVIAGTELSRNIFAVRRAETRTGADYYLGPAGAGEADLEDCLRLEVSGVDHGDRRDVARRLVEKISQARAGNSNLPALAGVMGFLARVIMLQDVDERS